MAALLIFSAIIAPLPAKADSKTVELAPSSPWHVDWTKTTCQMRRGFGAKEDFLILQFERFAPGDQFQLVVIGNLLRQLRQGNRLSVSYGSGAPIKIGYFFAGKTAKGTPTIFIPSSSIAQESDKDQDEAIVTVTSEMEAAVKAVSLSWSGKTLTINTGPLDKAFAALRACTDDLVKMWGLDPEEQKTLSRRPTPTTSPGRWLKPGDYPGPELRAGKQGIVNFWLGIDASGKPTECEIQRSYSDEAFDIATCKALMRKARFEPALDADGKPVPSFYANTVNFLIPGF